MQSLSHEEILELECEILKELPETLERALIKANRSGYLDELLKYLDLSHLAEPTEKIETYKDGTILVIGDSQVSEKDLLGVAKSLGIAKSRFEFCLDYTAAQTYKYEKLRYASKYSAVLFGPVPHKTTGTAESSSLIVELEKKHREGTVPAVIVRLVANGDLKITKSSFKQALTTLLEEGHIIV